MNQNNFNRLKGQTAIVTGSSSGIGQATAIALGREGANIIVNYVGNSTGAEQAVDEIQQMGGQAMAIKNRNVSTTAGVCGFGLCLRCKN